MRRRGTNMIYVNAFFAVYMAYSSYGHFQAGRTGWGLFSAFAGTLNAVAVLGSL